MKKILDHFRRWQQARAVQARPATLDGPAADIPPQIQAAWFAQAGDELPGWRPGAADWQLAARALVQFFGVCASQGDAACALPSKAADSIWHVWLREDAAGLAQWQRRHFGQEIPHREAAELGAPMAQALARSWAAANHSEGKPPSAMPLMFAADGRLRAPGGWAYGQMQGRVWHREIDRKGRATGEIHRHPGLAVPGLAAFGLLTHDELAAHERQREQAHSAGSSCGSFGASFGDGACGDGGSGGCSCGSGSSCGGSGCGGGGCGS